MVREMMDRRGREVKRKEAEGRRRERERRGVCPAVGASLMSCKSSSFKVLDRRLEVSSTSYSR